MNILTMCSGNYCRSPIAHGLLAHKLMQAGIVANVYSAGTTDHHAGKPASALNNSIIRAMGPNDFDHAPHTVTATEIEQADLILVMEWEHIRWIGMHYPTALRKTYLLSSVIGMFFNVPDPIEQDRDKIQAIAWMINSMLEQGLRWIIDRATGNYTIN